MEDTPVAMIEPAPRVYGPRTWRLRLIGAAASWAGLIAIFVWLVTRVWRESARLKGGDFRHFYWAAEAMREGEDPYAAGLVGYIYPPFYAWVIQPLVSLGQIGAERAWGWISLGLVAVSLWLAFRIVSERLRGPRDPLTVAFVILAGALLSISQFREEIEQGQTDTIVLAAFAASLYFLDRFPLVSGLALAVASQVKHQAILPVAYCLVRGRVKPLLGFVIAALMLAVLPMTTMGIDRWQHAMGRAYGYVSTVATGAEPQEGDRLHPITWEMSISIPSAVARMLETDEGVPTLPLMAIVGVIAGAVFALTWWIYRMQGVPMFAGRWGVDAESKRPGVVLIEWCGLFVALLAFSPQAMNRHGFILLFVNIFVAHLLFVPKRGVSRWPLIVGVVLYQIGMLLPPGTIGRETSFLWWRPVSGESWCMLALWLGLVWTGLSAVKSPYARVERAGTLESKG